MKDSLEMYGNCNTTDLNLWDAVKTILKGMFIALNIYIKKQEGFPKQPNTTP